MQTQKSCNISVFMSKIVQCRFGVITRVAARSQKVALKWSA